MLLYSKTSTKLFFVGFTSCMHALEPISKFEIPVAACGTALNVMFATIQYSIMVTCFIQFYLLIISLKPLNMFFKSTTDGH